MDSARMLQQQLALKDLVIQAFIPPPEVQKVSAGPHVVGGFNGGYFPCAGAAARKCTAPGHSDFIQRPHYAASGAEGVGRGLHYGLSKPCSAAFPWLAGAANVQQVQPSTSCM